MRDLALGHKNGAVGQIWYRITRHAADFSIWTEVMMRLVIAGGDNLALGIVWQIWVVADAEPVKHALP